MTNIQFPLKKVVFLSLIGATTGLGLIGVAQAFETPEARDLTLPCTKDKAVNYLKNSEDTKLASAKLSVDSTLSPTYTLATASSKSTQIKAQSKKKLSHTFDGQPGTYTFKVSAKGGGDLRLEINGKRIVHRPISNSQYTNLTIKTRPLQKGDKIGVSFVKGQALILNYLMLVPDAVSEGSVPWLRTEGRWLVNEKGQKVKLRGVSLCNYHQKYGGYAKRISEVTARQNGWYANVVRLPAYPGAIKRHGLENFVETYLDPAIEKCVEKGIYCIIDYHPVDRDWDAPNNKNHIIAREFWKHTAPKYQNISNVMYEVYNEPCRPRERSLQEWLKWRRLAQPWVDLIRARAPNNIVIVGSPACSSNPVHANTHPFQGNNLVYTYHAYPTQRTLRMMEKHIGAYKGERIPLFLTEFGWQPNGHHVHGGTTSGWGQTLKQFLEKRPYINWTAWAYSPTCGPSMLDKNWHLKGGEHMGQAIKGWIAEENK
ncbi:glycoside hydrolase family 5 protein [Pleurocapsales cyanobacterium LEGE 10410]|nr:glycoside hydrolase family 5 protein [Pleurocapsales cyanobacterium LEGE 10410]